MKSPAKKENEPAHKSVAQRAAETKGVAPSLKSASSGKPGQVTQRKAQQVANNSQRIARLKSLQAIANQGLSTAGVIQRVAWKDLPQNIKTFHDNTGDWRLFLRFLRDQGVIRQANDGSFFSFLRKEKDNSRIEALFADYHAQLAGGDEEHEEEEEEEEEVGQGPEVEEEPEEEEENEEEVEGPEAEEEQEEQEEDHEHEHVIHVGSQEEEDGKEEEEDPREAHLRAIRDEEIGPFDERDPMDYREAHPIFDENIAMYKHILSERQAKAAGFSGIVHFGTNKTLKGTAGVAAKPFAKTRDAYGGTELTWANNQSMLALIKNNRSIKAKTANVKAGVNNANISIARLQAALLQNELIYFHLNQFNAAIIQALVNDDGNYETSTGFKPVFSVTGQEFIHIKKNWDDFEHSVVFLRNLRPVQKPW